jgi:hypothetical protein
MHRQLAACSPAAELVQLQHLEHEGSTTMTAGTAAVASQLLLCRLLWLVSAAPLLLHGPALAAAAAAGSTNSLRSWHRSSLMFEKCLADACLSYDGCLSAPMPRRRGVSWRQPGWFRDGGSGNRPSASRRKKMNN